MGTATKKVVTEELVRNTINRDEINKAIAQVTKVSEANVNAVITAFFDLVLQSAMVEGKVVFLKPYGRFEKRIRKSRPYTVPGKKPIQAPAKEILCWQPFQSGKKVL